MSAQGRNKGEFRKAQPEGAPVRTRFEFDLQRAAVVAGPFGSLAALRAAMAGEAAPPPVDVAALAAAPLPAPARLAAGERRRASAVVRLVMACVEPVLADTPVPPDRLRLVFAADEGTGEVCQQMLEAVRQGGAVSPMAFTNSVQNAPSGYCAIGFGLRGSATVVSQGMESFACGLLCALSEMGDGGDPVLLVTYDPEMPAPLSELHPVPDACASAWLLAPAGSVDAPLARLACEVTGGLPPRPSDWPAVLPAAWAGLASGRSIAALGLIDAEDDASIDLALNGLTLTLQRVAGGSR